MGCLGRLEQPRSRLSSVWEDTLGAGITAGIPRLPGAEQPWSRLRSGWWDALDAGIVAGMPRLPRAAPEQAQLWPGGCPGCRNHGWDALAAWSSPGGGSALAGGIPWMHNHGRDARRVRAEGREGSLPPGHLHPQREELPADGPVWILAAPSAGSTRWEAGAGGVREPAALLAFRCAHEAVNGRELRSSQGWGQRDSHRSSLPKL